MERTSKVRALLFLLLSVLALAAVGCGAEADSERELTVFAAASLTDAFEGLGEEFERRNPGVEVRFSFAGSSGLLAQLRQGAPADVFASADEAKMRVALEGGIVSSPEVFAENSPVVVVSEANPAGVEGIRGLAEKEPTLVPGPRWCSDSRLRSRGPRKSGCEVSWRLRRFGYAKRSLARA